MYHVVEESDQEVQYVYSYSFLQYIANYEHSKGQWLLYIALFFYSI